VDKCPLNLGTERMGQQVDNLLERMTGRRITTLFFKHLNLVDKCPLDIVDKCPVDKWTHFPPL
jgi:hypothetical protein